MLSSVVGLKPALIQTLRYVDGVPVEFSNDDWKLMGKVLLVLEPFKDATDELSCNDASISMVIPEVTMIIKSLEKEDRRVEKRSLLDAMENRFADIEVNDEYIVATLLDPKWKGNFFCYPETLNRATTLLTDRLVDLLKDGLTAQVNLLI